jgi:hypothetical protein
LTHHSIMLLLLLLLAVSSSSLAIAALLSGSFHELVGGGGLLLFLYSLVSGGRVFDAGRAQGRGPPLWRRRMLSMSSPSPIEKHRPIVPMSRRARRGCTISRFLTWCCGWKVDDETTLSSTRVSMARKIMASFLPCA